MNVMSDIKLFETVGSVKELLSSKVHLEKELQNLIENNMELFFGVRFLKSEYAITNGRMDSIGIDENNSPVIFEYKRSSNENVITVENGVISAVGEGTAVITAISVSRQYQASCTVNVHQQWSFNPYNYAYDMVFYADISVHGEKFSDDMYVAAVCDDEIRGIAQLKEYNGTPYILIRVYSNFTQGDEIKFKVYKRNSAQVEMFPNVVVFDGESHGSLSHLYPLTIE
jgi:hypothetical protein